jgi:hypothetical protein
MFLNTVKYFVNIIILALIAVFLAMAGCAPTIPSRAQEEIYRVARFESEAENIIEVAAVRTGAAVALVGVYDTDYIYRIVAASTNEALTDEIGPMPVTEDGHRDILEEIRDGVVFYSLVSDLPEGSLKNELKAYQKQAIAAAPIYDPDGYLMGYVGLSWAEGPLPPVSQVEAQARSTADELTRLARIFS